MFLPGSIGRPGAARQIARDRAMRYRPWYERPLVEKHLRRGSRRFPARIEPIMAQSAPAAIALGEVRGIVMPPSAITGLSYCCARLAASIWRELGHARRRRRCGCLQNRARAPIAETLWLGAGNRSKPWAAFPPSAMLPADHLPPCFDESCDPSDRLGEHGGGWPVGRWSTTTDRPRHPTQPPSVRS